MGGVGIYLLVFELNRSFDPMDGAREGVSLTPGSVLFAPRLSMLTSPLTPLFNLVWGYRGGFCSGCLGSAPRVNRLGVLQEKPQQPRVN